MGFQMWICSILRFSWSIFGKVLCSSDNELQQNSNASYREYYIPRILTVLLEILRVTFEAFCLLSVIDKL